MQKNRVKQVINRFDNIALITINSACQLLNQRDSKSLTQSTKQSNPK